MGLPKLQFEELRKTFASLLLPTLKGVSTAVIPRLSEYYRLQLTNNEYANVEPVLHQAVNLHSVIEWS